MRIEVAGDVEWFAQRAGGFLAARPERNVLATVLLYAQTWTDEAEDVGTFAIGTDSSGDGEEVVAAALRTAPWPMLATGFEDRTAASGLLDAWLEHDSGLTGVSAEPATARAIAELWARRTGGTIRLKLTEALHELAEVIPPARPASGHLRQATDAEHDLLTEWDAAFASEAVPGDRGDAGARVERRLRDGLLYIWDDGGPVSMLAHTPAVAGAARIGPVYTPPEHRNHGYATSAVAALSQLLLDPRAERCMLYTDVTNPTSNRIYASIGYRRFADWEVLDFERPRRPRAARLGRLGRMGRRA